jgi:pseudouridine 5'-phosphatase
MGLQTEEVSRRIVEIYDLSMSWEQYAELAMREIDVLMGNCEKCEGAERLVRHLKKHKIPICLATSSSKKSFDVKTSNHQDLFDHFDHQILGSSDEEVKQGKPAPDIFLVAASRFPGNPKPENVRKKLLEI